MTRIEEKLKELSDQELIDLTNELKHTLVPEDALIRKVIKDTELDTMLPLLAFVGVGQKVGHELAERLTTALKKLDVQYHIINKLSDGKKMI